MSFADIKPIPEHESPGILGTKTLIIGNLLTLAPALLFFGGVGLAAWDCHQFLLEELRPADNEPRLAAGGLLIGLGIPLAVIGALWAFRNTTWLANVYLKHYTRQVIGSRPEALVQPNDPEAVFVEIVPPENCRLMLETATDVGFLKIDSERREVLFEGGLERMRIPAGAVHKCGVARTVFGPGTGSAVKYFFVRLAVRLPDETREIQFAPRGDFGQWGAGVREQRCRSLQERILKMAERW